MNKTSSLIDSFLFDQRLAEYDIEGSVAHVKMLVKTNIIPSSDGKKIIGGLTAILSDIKKGKKIPPAEDIHFAIEKELIRRIGPVGGKMHTARSRNDQVALDLRLYVRGETGRISGLLSNTIKNITTQASENIDAVMPGFTHLQPAQPVLFSHHLLAYGWMFQRDRERLNDCLKRVNVSPLGSAALAGTSFKIDRKFTAGLLGFPSISDNSIDAVSDRDFAIEFLSVLSIISLHMSRFSEEMVIWSSAQFGFVRLSDEFTSGSSIMPQKRNPDVSEIIRGKTGRVYGNLISFLTIMKGLPLSYNRDMQEDKPPVFDAVDTVTLCLQSLNKMIETMSINDAAMLRSTDRGFLAATELADYLARKGVPFRQAHGIVRQIVDYCIKSGKTLSGLEITELKRYSNLFGPDTLKILNAEYIVRLKTSEGGTSPQSVKNQIKKLKQLI